MKSLELSLRTVLGAVVAAGALGVAAATVAPWTAHARAELTSSGSVAALLPVTTGTVRHGRLATRSADAAGEVESAAERDTRDASEVRRRIQENESGTYIGEVLLDRDSALTRWPDRNGRPLRVWIQPSLGVADWDSSFVGQVRSAFLAWADAGIPIQFTFVTQSSKADIHVNWVDKFNEPISGKTLWSRDSDWWIVDGDITLAIHHSDGEPLDSAAVRAIALHEVGHLIGLDHTTDVSNIMAPKVRVRDLSAADRATVRLLYSLPAGKVK